MKPKLIQWNQFEPKSALYEIVAFFQKNQHGIGPMQWKMEEMGQNWILEPKINFIQ